MKWDVIRRLYNISNSNSLCDVSVKMYTKMNDAISLQNAQPATSSGDMLGSFTSNFSKVKKY